MPYAGRVPSQECIKQAMLEDLTSPPHDLERAVSVLERARQIEAEHASMSAQYLARARRNEKGPERAKR
jgi:hypothetical protein